MYVGLSDHYSCLVYQVRTEIVTFVTFFGDRDFPLSALFEKDVKRYR